MKLADCKIGRVVAVQKIDLDDEYRFRLKEIGISVGTRISVNQHCSFGGKLISKGSERIGIDRKLADAIIVEYVVDNLNTSLLEKKV